MNSLCIYLCSAIKSLEQDTLSASTTLLTHFSAALSQYAAHGHPMREYLKSIRTREENLDELKRRRKAVSSKADAAEKKLSRMSPEHKNLHLQTDALNVLRAEIRSLDSDIMSEEAALGDFKRTTTRQWLGLKFGALLECSEKGTVRAVFTPFYAFSHLYQIVGEYGKQVVAVCHIISHCISCLWR
jgi:predicted RNase H-like nuclease (RuvC/YqgF family)